MKKSKEQFLLRIIWIIVNISIIFWLSALLYVSYTASYSSNTEYIKAIDEHGYRYTDMNDNTACAKCGKIYNFSNIRQTINKAHMLLNNR